MSGQIRQVIRTSVAVTRDDQDRMHSSIAQQQQAQMATINSVMEIHGGSNRLRPVGDFDYLTIDAEDHYLISAHLAAGQTYVIDLGTNKVVATIADTPGAEGVEYVPELKKFYTSNAGDNTIGVVDLRQMKVVKKLPTEKKPDGSGTRRRHV